jgi:hypothetical protein
MRSRTRVRRRLVLAVTAVAAVALVLVAVVAANVGLTKLSTDPFTNATSQHKTEVEPDTFARGKTIVMVTQVGRFFDGGSSDIGFAVSKDGGATWNNGFMPGLTVYSTPAGPYARASDPSVAYDAKHKVWMASSLALDASVRGVAVALNRSTNGGTTWQNAIAVTTAGPSSSLDKNWTACDNTSTSPFYGSCYTEWDDNGLGNIAHVAYSRDGGLTWQEGTVPAASILGGQPVVQPSGTVIMPTANGNVTAIVALRSTNGGVSWSTPVTVSSITDHGVAGNLRTEPLPSAAVDKAGKVYVAWQDCRFRSGCSSNDIVYSKSSDGVTWTAVKRVPIDATTSTVDHFIPGFEVAPGTRGKTALLGLVYYYYPNTSCSSSTCQLDVGFVSSLDGGATWSAPTQLAGPMTLSWLPNTSQGRMVGDYMSTSFSQKLAFPGIQVANKPGGGNDCAVQTPNCDEALYTPTAGLAATAGVVASGNEQPVPGAASDHPIPSAPLTAR